MGRTAAKRKSEGDLLVGKRQSRKISARKGDSDSTQVETESGDQFLANYQPSKAKHVKKPVGRSRKSEPARRLNRSDEYEEDEGRLESQQFLALVEFESKKKKQVAKSTSDYIDRFTQAVNQDEQVLKQRIEIMSEKSTKRDIHFIEAFTDAFAASQPKAPSAKDTSRGTSSSSAMAFASLYVKSRQITTALAIVERFEQVNEQTSKIDTFDLIDKDAWVDEIDMVENILDSGYTAGLERYQRLLDASKLPEVDEGVSGLAETFYLPSEVCASVGWGKIAKKSEKAARKLVKALPLEIVS